MSHAHYHAQSSARRFGGVPDDYIHFHEWFDETKTHLADARHRALRHHSQGIFELERTFGRTITNSDGREVPVRLIGEQHVKEDCGGFIPTVADWLGTIRFEPWMNFGYRRSLAVERGERDAPEPSARRAEGTDMNPVMHLYGPLCTADHTGTKPCRKPARQRRQVSSTALLDF